MNAFERLAETRIERAIESGELDDLAGAGRPLDLEALRAIPPEERAALTVLRNAGIAPEEIETRRELARVEGELARDPGARAAEALRRRRLALQLKRDLAADRRLGRL